MNKNQVQWLRLIIEKSRARLMVSAPSFALLLMYIRFVAVPGMDRISTNGTCIFFDPKYLEKLKDEEMDFILCHQMMHVLYEDIWRSETDASCNYHFACDLRINAVLLEERAFRHSRALAERMPHKIPGERTAVKDMHPQDILGRLFFNIEHFDLRLRKKYLIDSDVYWGGEPFAFGATLILDRAAGEYLDIVGRMTEEDDKREKKDDQKRGARKCTDGGSIKAGRRANADPEVNAELLMADPGEREKWEQRAAMALHSSLGGDRERGGGGGAENGGGDAAFLMKRIVKRLRNPRIDWRKVLDDFICEQVSDYSFAPPDRRFSETDFFLPDFNERDSDARDILFMVDTSCSVRDKDLALVYSEIKGAIEQYGGRLVGRIGFFDGESTTPVPIQSVRDLLSVVPVGGGGTSFYSIFSSFKSSLPSCLIVFTDGESEFPPQSIAQGVPVLWVINHWSNVVPWGKLIRLYRE